MNKIKSYFVGLIVIAIAIGTTSVANASFLSVGSRGGAVADLQTFLIGKGFPIPLIESGAASKGYFGSQTKTAVEMYQESVETQPTGSIEFPVTDGSSILGAAAGPDIFYRTFFNAGLTRGGNLATTSLSSLSSYTTQVATFGNLPSVIQWNNGVNMTLTLSGTSTMKYIPRVGDVVDVFFRNASSTAGSAITFAAADSGLDLQFAEATGGDLVLNGLDWAKLTLIRTSANLVTVIFDEMTEAD